MEWDKITFINPELKSSYPIYMNPNSLLIITEDEYKPDIKQSLSILRMINRECGHTFRSIKFKAKTSLLSTKEMVSYLKDVFQAEEVKDES